jgi:heptosyltransferase I
MTLNLKPPPQRVCLLRLSAIGDTCHVVAVLRALQTAWPQTRFTWIVGAAEAKLLASLLTEIEFITFDKRATASELLRINSVLRSRSFDVLLHMQLSFRASLISTLVRSPVKLGFDRARAREMQWLFTNSRIEAREREHVLDSLMGFVRACDIDPGEPQWRIDLPAQALDYAARSAPGDQPTLLISPCASHAARNWSATRYAAIAAHAMNRHGMRVFLVGGPSSVEHRMGAAIESQAGAPVINNIGKDTLPGLLALMARSTVLLTPDSGPAHMATMVGLPVIGLYAATNSARSGPYLSREHCVDKYDAAARAYLGKPAQAVPWTTKIEIPGVMDLISVGEVAQKLDALLTSRKPG